jgi:hypothetical protein
LNFNLSVKFKYCKIIETGTTIGKPAHKMKTDSDMIENLIKDLLENFEAEVKGQVWTEIQSAITN